VTSGVSSPPRCLVWQPRSMAAQPPPGAAAALALPALPPCPSCGCSLDAPSARHDLERRPELLRRRASAPKLRSSEAPAPLPFARSDRVWSPEREPRLALPRLISPDALALTGGPAGRPLPPAAGPLHALRPAEEPRRALPRRFAPGALALTPGGPAGRPLPPSVRPLHALKPSACRDCDCPPCKCISKCILWIVYGVLWFALVSGLLTSTYHPIYQKIPGFKLPI